MTEQIRSADLLVRTALADPEILAALKEKPEETLKDLGKNALQQLPPGPLPTPTRVTNDAIWLIVVTAFAAVMLGSAYVLGTGVSAELKVAAKYATSGETMLTVFTTVAVFLV